MIFEVFGRFEIEARQEPGVTCRLGPHMRCRDHDLVFPSDLAEVHPVDVLADSFQDFDAPGLHVRRIR